MAQSIYIISGGPGTGKTSTIKELKKRGFKILPEATREIASKDKRFIGKSIKEINMSQFQEEIFNLQKNFYLNNCSEGIIFSDRGFGDTLAYYKINNLDIPKDKFDYANRFSFAKIFILDFLNFYETDELRMESKREQEIIQNEIIKMYQKLNYKPIIVPFDSLENRVNFILNKIKQT
ncbi:MAG: ATP-binding protein [Nanoarchaeota archaeon]